MVIFYCTSQWENNNADCFRNEISVAPEIQHAKKVRSMGQIVWDIERMDELTTCIDGTINQIRSYAVDRKQSGYLLP